MTGWFPIADDFDVIPRHVARTQLLGHELVAWRADDGNVNVWENRCLHRGVRLSLGTNDGAELVCRYHAWRYANRSGGCTYIPAHPADAPPRTVQSLTFPVVEQYGLVWTSLDEHPGGEPTEVAALADGHPFVMRARPVAASEDEVLAALGELWFAPSGVEGDESPSVTATTVPGGVQVSSSARGITETVVFFVQPAAPGRCVVRPVRAGGPRDRLGTLRHHASVLGRFVEEIEAVSRDTAVATPVPLPARRSVPGRLQVRVARKWDTAEGVVALDLETMSPEALPAAQAGDHIDLHLPNGLTRQYSLTNAPGETASYRIGVKLASDSTGGSAYLHDQAQVGDTLEISAPRNGFPLRRNVARTILIAGGIGITPILAMAQTLARVGLGFELHHFVRSSADVAFRETLDALGDAVEHHVGLDPAGTRRALVELLAAPDSDAQIAACGPPAMLDVIRAVAAEAGWPDASVTFEYFENTTEIDRSSVFTAELARSALQIDVAAGESLLEALRRNGLPLDSSCESGACGTCEVAVLEGVPLHQDVYLNATEREAGDRMLSCVSRSLSRRLVLDL